MNVLRNRNLHTVVMILCFIYGGISLLFFIFQMSNLYAPMAVGPEFGRFQPNGSFNDTLNASLVANGTAGDRPERIIASEPRVAAFFHLIILISLSGSIISITAGISLYTLLRKKERKELKSGMIDLIATPEESTVIKTLQENGGELTQSELVKRTGFSKVKTHRIIKRLENRSVLEKHPYGLTNKIRPNNKLHEDGK